MDRNYLEGIHLVIYPRRGSREPCGSKFLRSCSLTLSSGRGSREPCGSKFFLGCPPFALLCRGSREPCGSKWSDRPLHLSGIVVEARESLVDRNTSSGRWGYTGVTSRLARALWIEIRGVSKMLYVSPSRLARALWIEIPSRVFCTGPNPRRGSREPCGSKYAPDEGLDMYEVSRLARALWIEMEHVPYILPILLSRLARALWIEILLSLHLNHCLHVEARESLVDRNSPITGTIFTVCCQGSREPCGLKCRRPFPEGRQLCRGSREPCGFKFYRWNILFYRPCK